MPKSFSQKGVALIPLIIGSLAVAIVGWIIFGQSQTGMKKEPIRVKVGIIAPLTKELIDYGVNLRNAVVLATREINSRGLIQIELVEKDNEGTPELSKRGAEQLVADPAIVGVIGPVTSSNTIAAAQVLQKEGLVDISPSATNPKISTLGDYIFRVVPSDIQQGEELARYTVEELKIKRVAILIDEAKGAKDYSEGLANVYSERLKSLGGEVAVSSSYTTGTQDFTSQLNKIKAVGNIELIFMPGYTNEPAFLAQQIKKAGLNIRIMGGDGVGDGVQNGELVRRGGKAVEGLIATTFFDPRDPALPVQHFVSEYKTNFGTTPSWVAAYSYDAMRVLAEAIEKTGSPNRKLIRDNLAKIKDFPGLNNQISFDSNGDVVGGVLKIIIKDGQYEIIK